MLTPNNPVNLRWENDQGIIFEKRISIDDEYLFTVNQSIKNTTEKKYNFYSYGQIIRNTAPEVTNFYILHEGLLGVFDEQLVEKDYDDVEDEGDLNHFRALSTALAATVGIGNIAGVAIAIYYGGPGALFWMWITAFFGTALKYSECTLALQYRETDSVGNTAGGPMYTIENGLGPKWRWLAVAFACFAIICSFFTGNAIQSFTLTDQLYSQFLPLLGSENWLMSKSVVIEGIFEPSIFQIVLGLMIASIVAMVILGGIKRIGNVTGYLVPIMAVIYVFTALFIILSNYEKVGESFGTIFKMAFNPPAEIAGISAGAFIAFLNTMMMGVKRGLFSSEAGQGSAAIAHSTAKTKYSVREGVVALLEPYIDTIVICTLTGLVIMVTDKWH